MSQISPIVEFILFVCDGEQIPIGIRERERRLFGAGRIFRHVRVMSAGIVTSLSGVKRPVIGVMVCQLVQFPWFLSSLVVLMPGRIHSATTRSDGRLAEGGEWAARQAVQVV